MIYSLSCSGNLSFDSQGVLFGVCAVYGVRSLALGVNVRASDITREPILD